MLSVGDIIVGTRDIPGYQVVFAVESNGAIVKTVGTLGEAELISNNLTGGKRVA